MHQYAFFNADLSYDMIRQSFYTILKKAILSLYVHPHTLIKSSERNDQGIPISDVKAGDTIQCIIRIQGISQLIGKNGMRLRLHHYVPSVWKA
jgi:hypothetical protein